jgi:alpha-amylase
MTPRRHPHPLALLGLTGALLGLADTALAVPFNPRDTSVQMFEWSWNDIATECTQWLGPQGYGAVQISPPGASKNANGWWGVYQPVNYVGLSSRMGNASQLQAMINTCHTAGVRIYADIVVNQMADGSGTATDGSAWNANTLSYPFFSANDFHANCTIQGADYNSPAGRANVMNCRLGGLPDLATENSYVQGQIATYLRSLLNLGVDGFRIDAAKHMPATALLSILNAVKSTNPLTKSGEPIWVTQEIIPDGGVTRSDYFSVGTVNEFQFTTAMRDVFRGNNGLSLSSIPSIMGTWGNWGGSWGFVQPQFATIFVNNWDTERNGGSLNAANDTGATNDTAGTKRYDLANIFMLAQGYGEAQLHSGFRFTNADGDRPAASPYLNGVPQINVNWDFVHRWSDISNIVKFRSAVNGQAQQNWVVGNNGNQVAFNRGSMGFVALNNSAASWTRTFATGLPAGTYCNVVQGTLNGSGTACTGGTVAVAAGGNATVTVAANNGGSTVPAVVIYTGQKLSGGGTTCAVSFTIANANTTLGQNLYVVGNLTALGNWTPASGYALAIQGSGANVPWTGTVSLPANTAVQYKYVKWNGSTAVWESNQATGSGNREFTSCAAGGTQSRPDGNFKF